MSFAIVTSARGVEIDGGSLYLSESQISQAILSQWFPASSNTAIEVQEVNEIVAQFFDALEEKRSTEEADVAEYAGGAYDLFEIISDERATVNDLSGQIDRLAGFILNSVPGEPSQSEAAVDTAIRVIKNLVIEVSRLNSVNTALNDAVVLLKAGNTAPVTPTKSPFENHWYTSPVPVPVPAIDWNQVNCAGTATK